MGVQACICLVMACSAVCMRARGLCWRADQSACAHVPRASVQIDVQARTWLVLARRSTCMRARGLCWRAHRRAREHAPCAGVQTDVHACMCQVLACTSTCMRACARCRRAHRPACVHVPGAGVHIGVLACTWVAQAYRRDIPGCQTDVHACSLMPTKSIQYCRRAAAIEDQQGTVPCEQLPLQAEETSLLSCKRKCQREEVIFSINTARSYIWHLRSVRPKIQKKSMSADGRKATVK